jgi:hypothetical protein
LYQLLQQSFPHGATGKLESQLMPSLQSYAFTSKASLNPMKFSTVLAFLGVPSIKFKRRLYDETGHVVKPRSEFFFGCPRILNLEDLHYLLELVHHRPDFKFAVNAVAC